MTDHSCSGLITQKPAGLGLAVASVAIDPAPFVVCCRCRSPPLRASAPVLANPLNYRRSVMLTEKQFRFAFGNAVSDAESAELYETYAVPGPGRE